MRKHSIILSPKQVTRNFHSYSQTDYMSFCTLAVERHLSVLRLLTTVAGDET